MNKIISGLTLGIAALSLYSCSKSSSSAPTTSGVMFVNGCFAGSSVVNLDGERNGTVVASSIPYMGNSGYRQVTAGTGVAVAFYPTGLSLLTGASENLTVGNNYSAFAAGTITQPAMVFTSDDLSAPGTGMAKVRFVNLSGDGLNLSCYVGTPKVDSNVAYLSATPFIQVAAGTYNIGLYDQTSTPKNALLSGKQLASGKIYTFVFTGSNSVYTLTEISNN